MSALLRDISTCFFRDGIRLVTSLVFTELKHVIEGLGFRELPGTYDYIFKKPYPYYELDFRTTSLELWYEWLALGKNMPRWLTFLLTFTREAWKETIKKALDNLNNLSILEKNPLAELAVEAMAATCGKTLPKGEALHQLIASLIRQMAGHSTGIDSCDNQNPGKILIVTYLEAHSREEAAERLYLPSSTYYRWLGRAVGQLAEYLHKKAMEMAEEKFIIE